MAKAALRLVPKTCMTTLRQETGYFFAFFLPDFFLPPDFFAAVVADFEFFLPKMFSQFAENCGVGPVRTIGPDIALLS